MFSTPLKDSKDSRNSKGSEDQQMAALGARLEIYVIYITTSVQPHTLSKYAILLTKASVYPVVVQSKLAFSHLLDRIELERCVWGRKDQRQTNQLAKDIDYSTVCQAVIE
jgi:hypothetical protein